MFKNIQCVAIVVAGGTGSRFGGDVPKQFVPLGGLPVVAHSLLKFQRCDFIDYIILAANSNYWEFCRNLASENSITKLTKIVDAGQNRSHSVRNALEALDDTKCLVLVHDAARPFVDAAKIGDLLEAARTHKAATLGLAATDTLKYVDDDECITETIPRESIFSVQTPQAFLGEVILKAYENNEISYSDDCMAVEKIGIKPKILQGSSHNIKITHQIDIEIAEILLEKGIIDAN